MKRLRLAVALFVSVVAIGIGGFMLIEGWSFNDAIYMTFITMTTVGFKEVHPMSVVGQYFTIALLLAGTGTAFYLLISITEFLIEGHLSGILTERKVERDIKKLEDHYILCGFGKVGENVAEEFMVSNVPFVVIESSPSRVAECREAGMFCVEGDASSDEVLMVSTEREVLSQL
jgi:voltage-gated potassium channel